MTITVKQALQVEHDAAKAAGNFVAVKRLRWLMELVNESAEMTVSQFEHVISNVKLAKSIDLIVLATFINTCRK